ncbi:MAG TPA: hypothetical protein VFB59_03055 [Candidatus Saccharimonadales bacterium]|nr:hypothetical protein [Candidatus Saccharimonadales bacterium]
MAEQSSYERRIEVALRDAQVSLPLNSQLEQFAALPYDTLLPPFPSEITRSPGDVLFDDIEELSDVLDVLQQMTNVVVDLATRELIKGHETQHGWGAKVLKGSRSVCGMNLMPDGDDAFVVRNYFYFPLDLQVNKLGLALIFGHPRFELRQDIKDIRTMGFTGGIQEIGELALAENTRLGEYKYPIPLSF